VEAPPSLAAVPAVYCRTITREIDLFLWFEGESRFFSMEEGWHASNKVALIEGGRTFILDKERNRFLFLNRNRRTYLEVPLPVTRATAYSPDLARLFEERKTSRRVEPLYETQQILGRTCDGFRLINRRADGPGGEYRLDHQRCSLQRRVVRRGACQHARAGFQQG
jgi:hypothetical protein